jgi:hypothetical protein
VSDAVCIYLPLHVAVLMCLFVGGDRRKAVLAQRKELGDGRTVPTVPYRGSYWRLLVP